MAELLKLELPEILQPLEPLLQTIAESWIAYGATNVAVWGDGQIYANWAGGKHDITESQPTHTQMSAPIKVGDKTIAQLHIFGPNNRVKKKRLRLDADIVASKLEQSVFIDEQGTLNRRLALLQAKIDEHAGETAALESDLQALEHQFTIFRQVAQINMSGISLSDCLYLIREELAELVPVESVFTWVDSLETPQQIEAFPRPLTSQGKILKYLQEQPVQDEIINNYPHIRDLPTSVRNLVAFPLMANEDIRIRLGFINQRYGDFTNEDVDTIRMFVTFLQQHIQQVFTEQQQGQSAQLRAEMEEAFAVQDHLFPQTPPEIPGLDLYAYSRAAKHVGGDFYDYFTRYDGQLAFAVGDVSGKGVSSALMMGITRTLLKSKSNRGDLGTPQAIMAETVGDVYEDFMRVKMFATAFVGFFNPFTMELTYANAGHSPVIYSPLHGETLLLDSGSPPLGVLEATYPLDETMQLNPGDCLVIASDGLSEAHSIDGGQFSDGRLAEIVAAYGAESSAAELARLIFTEIDAFSDGAGQSDDQTLLILKIE